MVRLPRAPIVPAAGGGKHFPLAWKTIRFSRMGCVNRPFYHIVVIMSRRHQHDHPIEQLGTYDPLPNVYNEKLVSLNIERLRYWLSHRTKISKPVMRLLGLSGFLPMHPDIYIRAWKNRREALREKEEKEKPKSEETESEEQSDQKVQ